ncbi:MAG: zinc-ribbon domain-containing protein [Paracoccus sp. (in: a-proteobacteria)]
MRLTCPQCNARYDLPAGLIPPEGREVECSACGHVWHQVLLPGGVPAMAEPVMPAPVGPAAPTEPEIPANIDPQPVEDLQEAPVLRRPLPDDVLAILREETARELHARRAARGESISEDAAAPGSESLLPPPPTMLAITRMDQPETAAISPPSRVAAPPTAAIAGSGAADIAPGSAESGAEQQNFGETPPQSVGEDGAALSAHGAGDDEFVLNRALTAEGETRPDPPPVPRRRISRGLPDVEQLAASLQVKAPPPLPPALAFPAPVPVASEDENEPAASGYRAGLSRALGVAAAVIGVYLLAAFWAYGGEAPEPVSQVMSDIDSARAGMQDPAMGLAGQGAR